MITLGRPPWHAIRITACLGGACLLGLDALREGPVSHLDRRLLARVGAEPDSIDVRADRYVTALGSRPITYALAAAPVAVALIRNRPTAQALLPLAVAATADVTRGALCATVHRARPAPARQLAVGKGWSFPSRHTTLSYLAPISAARALTSDHGRAAATIAVLYTLTVGVSRIRLRVHWPSDVVAGWLLGIGWAALFHPRAAMSVRHGFRPR